MTMLSFRVPDTEAAAVETWARRLGVDRSELLRDALRHHLSALAAELESDAYAGQPVTDAEKSLTVVADWGPAEDWSDWSDATR